MQICRGENDDGVLTGSCQELTNKRSPAHDTKQSSSFMLNHLVMFWGLLFFFPCSLSALLCESVQRKEHRSGQRSEYIYLVTRKGGTKKSKQQFLAEELGFHQIFISVLCPLNRGPWWWRITVHLREAAPAGRALLMKSSSCSGSAEAHRLFLFRVNNWVRQGRAVHISSTDHLSLPLPCRLPSVSTTTTEPGRSTAPLNKHVWNLSDFSGLSSALIFGKVIIIYGLFSPEEQRCFGPLY